MSTKIKLAMNGACGKMGRQIIACAARDASFEIVGAIDHSQSPFLGKDIGELIGVGALGIKVRDQFDTTSKPDVIIDFSTVESSEKLIRFAEMVHVPLVIGTTGFSEKAEALIKEFSKKTACVKSPNMSVGVNLLFLLVKEAARLLGDQYDVEVVEAHHHLKKDAPSGTAKKLVEILAETLDRDLKKDIVTGRDGMVGERRKKEIGVFAVRAGDIVGDHTVLFGGPGERLELIHRAHTRETFAQGALRAAKFVVKAKPGLYSMQDVLGIGIK